MDDKVSNKRKRNDKPICKYGSECYRKNPEHRKKFKHPPEKVTIADSQISIREALKANISRESIPLSPKSNAPPEKSEVDSFSDKSVIEPDCADTKVEETVEEILKSMPQDFFDFWKFCESVNKSKPQDAFLKFGYKLVGVFDLLAKKLPKDKKVDISCHWRYFYDPPEFQTVIKKHGKELYHIGYFRDDPSEKPCILASNSAAVDSKLALMGDNIFCAMKYLQKNIGKIALTTAERQKRSLELKKVIKSSESQVSKTNATGLQKRLLEFASLKKYSVDVPSNNTERRKRKVVAKTFHGLGIVVPVKNDIGYRPLPDSDATIKNILKKIVTAHDDEKRLEYEEPLDELISNVQFANDECDYGMGLELGIDLFCYGDPYLHKVVLTILPLAYDLLNRSKYAMIVKAHLKNRKKGDDLSTL